MTIIRDMTAADLDAAARLGEQLVQQHHAWDPQRFFTLPELARGYRHFLRSQLALPGVLLLTAELDGQVAGYLYGTEEERDWELLLDPCGAVHDVFVDEAFRRRGVGRALMLEAKARFQARGLPRVVLSSATANLQGQALFRELGFRPTMVELTLEL